MEYSSLDSSLLQRKDNYGSNSDNRTWRVEAREDWREAARRAIEKPTDEEFSCWDMDHEAHRLYERYKTCLLQFCDVERALGKR